MRRRLLRPVGSGPDGTAALAPLVDVVTLLLLFLLRAWSTDPPVRPGDLDFQLPRSATEEEVRLQLAIDLGEEAIWVDDRRVASSVYYATHDDALVREVYDVLLRRSPKRVNVRADADVSYRVLRKLMFTLREAGVQDVSLVTESRAGL